MTFVLPLGHLPRNRLFLHLIDPLNKNDFSFSTSQSDLSPEHHADNISVSDKLGNVCKSLICSVSLLSKILEQNTRLARLRSSF